MKASHILRDYSYFEVRCFVAENVAKVLNFKFRLLALAVIS